MAYESASNPNTTESAATVAESPVRPMSAGVLSYATPESICGHDDRKKVTNTTDVPYQWICRLSMEFDGSSFVGSGALVNTGSTKHLVIVTSGHCVFSTGSKKFADKITVIPAANGSAAPWGSWEVDKSVLRASAAWQAGGGRENDYGAILVPYPGHAWGIGMWVADDAELKNREVTNSGYPADKTPYGFNWEDSGPLTQVDSQLLHYMNDTYGGESGSPVLTQRTPDNWWTVGVHGYGGCPNKAVRITQAVYDDIIAWGNS